MIRYLLAFPFGLWAFDGAAGRIASGRLQKFPGDETSLTKLYLTMLNRVGVPTGLLSRLEI